MTFNDFSEFVSTLPKIGDVIVSSYNRSHVGDDVDLSVALRELSVANPRVYGLLLEYFAFCSSVKEDSFLY
ncbi:hypothetical protein [Sigmofec virus UA08Rod_6554]|uniref:Uncharacterized protein n=1 Tax=Sigmofec virus UA08Rod_6554 TaxID=2929234 RepID=A0A976N1A9_9VIRU|nr:hypothetical protein [Sigmofec virus UA08Rod_6554]